MATQSYTVKSGDTLSGIAKNAGVGVNDVTGYKSGNPDLIMPGENLTIGSKADTTGSTAASNPATDYASTVKTALTKDSSTPTSTMTGVNDSYLSGLRDSITSAQKTVSAAATSLAGLKTNAYNEAYASAGLGDIKTNIATTDQQIADAKAARDAAVSKVRANPGLSAALLTGTVSKLSDKANADINNLIATRNALAGQYNTGLTEVGSKVDAKTADALTAYNTAKDALSTYTGQAQNYQSALVDTLKNKQQQDYQNNSLAISLMNANTMAKNASTRAGYNLARDSNGNPLYWIDPQGNIQQLTAQDQTNAGTTGGNGYGNLDTGAAGAGNGTGNGATPGTPADTTPWYQKLLGAFGIGG